MKSLKDLKKTRECQIDEIYETWFVIDILTYNNSMFKPEMILTDKQTTLITMEPIIAAQNTLISIDFCVQRGFLSDAFVLMRKYRDDLLLYLYLLYKTIDVENNKVNATTKIPIDFDEDKIFEMITEYYEKVITENSKDKDKIIIQHWKNGEYLGTNDKSAKDTFSAKNYSTIFEKKFPSNDTNSQPYYIHKAFNKMQLCYNQIGRKLNDFTHVNSPECLRCNGFLEDKEYKEKTAEIFDILQKTTIIFLCLLAMINPTAFSSNDYIDIMELTGQRIEGLQYNVPNGITDYLKKYSCKVSDKILDYINKYNQVGMKFIVEN